MDMEWIDAKEELPQFYSDDEGIRIVIAAYKDDGGALKVLPLMYVRETLFDRRIPRLMVRWKHMDWKLFKHEVVYWMELPEPPERVEA